MRVEINVIARWFCACGNMFGRSGWPVPPDVEERLGQSVCPLCKTIDYIGAHDVHVMAHTPLDRIW